MRTTSYLRLTFLFAMGVCALNAQRSFAAPNTDEPLSALSVRSEETVQQLSAAATKEYQQASAAITDIMQKLKDNEVKRINPKEFGAAYIGVLRMRRIGKHLEQWGETAGIDFQKRADAVYSDWLIARNEFLKLSDVAAKLPLLVKTVETNVKNRQKTLGAAGKLYQQQKYEEAETVLNKDLDGLEEMGALLDNSQKTALTQFWQASGKITEELNKLRTQAGKDHLLALIAAEPPGFEPLLEQMKQAVTDLKAAQNPKFDGQEMSGPEFVAAAGAAWQKAQLATVHDEGYYFSMDVNRSGAGSEPLTKLAGEQEAFSAKFLGELAGIISADAARTSAADAEAIYLAYLKELATLANQAQAGTVEQAVASPLKELAARSAELQANATAYDSATSDLLRWRKLIAEQKQKAASASFQSIPETFSPVLTLKGEGTVGLLPAAATKMETLAILSPLPLVCEQMKKELVGKQVLLPACASIVPAKKLVASHYQDRHYATFTLPAGFDVETQALKADLMVSDDLPPLSLAATKAVMAADRGDLEAAGVVVNRIHIEPLATRLATLPAAASPILPLGPLPREGGTTSPLSQVLLRSDVQPTWVRNEYFFVGEN